MPERPYRCDVDARCEVSIALYLRPVNAVQDLAHVRCQGGEDLGPLASHAHKTDR